MSTITAPVIAPAQVGTSTFTEYKEEDGDHERMSHIVMPSHLVVEAQVMGTPVTALCGKTWIPTKDPQRFGVCPSCIEEYERRYDKPWSGRR